MSVLNPAPAVAGAGLFNAAASTQNQALIVIVLMNENRKKILKPLSVQRRKTEPSATHKDWPADTWRPTRLGGSR